MASNAFVRRNVKGQFKKLSIMERGAGGRYVGLSDWGRHVRQQTQIKIDSKIQENALKFAKRMQDNAVYSIRGLAYQLMLAEQSLIVTAKGPSKPGQPPHTRGRGKKSLRAAIKYNFDKASQDAVVGPAYSMLGDAAEPHAKGVARRRGKDRRPFKKRPFAEPALDRVKDRFSRNWKVA